MITKRIFLLTILFSLSLSAPAVYADDAGKDDFDAWIAQMNKQFEASRAEWEKRKNMSLEELRAYEDARWAEWEKSYKEEVAAAEKEFEAARANWEKRRHMSLEELRAEDDARWAEREKQYQSAREKWQKMYQ